MTQLTLSQHSSALAFQLPRHEGRLQLQFRSSARLAPAGRTRCSGVTYIRWCDPAQVSLLGASNSTYIRGTQIKGAEPVVKLSNTWSMLVVIQNKRCASPLPMHWLHRTTCHIGTSHLSQVTRSVFGNTTSLLQPLTAHSPSLSSLLTLSNDLFRISRSASDNGCRHGRQRQKLSASLEALHTHRQ